MLKVSCLQAYVRHSSTESKGVQVRRLSVFTGSQPIRRQTSRSSFAYRWILHISADALLIIEAAAEAQICWVLMHSGERALHMAKSPIIVERPLRSVAHEVYVQNTLLRRQAIPADGRQQDVRNDLEKSVFLDLAAHAGTAIAEKERAAQRGAVDAQGETAAGQQLDGVHQEVQQKELFGLEQPKTVDETRDLTDSEAHKQRNGDHQQQQQHTDDEQQDKHAQQQQR